MNRIWVTPCGMVHYRKPEQESREYVEVTDRLPQVSGMGVAVEASHEMPAEIYVAVKDTSPPMMIATKKYYTGEKPNCSSANVIMTPTAPNAALDATELTDALLKVLTDSWDAWRDADKSAEDCTKYAVRDVVLFLEVSGIIALRNTETKE